jgi:hypothetical protein
MAVDHLLADARSLTILSEELIAACHAFASGVAPVLPPVRVQMADYALWQRKHEKEILARHLPYWLDCLANAQPLALPSDWPRSCLQTFSEGRYDFELCDARVTSALRSLTGPSHSTISMLILAGCVALLARWTKQTSIVLRHTVSSRNHPDLGNTVGFLFDHVLLHIDVADDPDFLSIVRRVKDAALGAQEHALVPLNVLMHALGRADATALCETFAFNFIPREMASQETAIAARAAPPLTDLTISPFPITTESQRAFLDMTLGVAEATDRLHGQLLYATELFSPTTAESFAIHLTRLMRKLVGDPHVRLSRVSDDTLFEVD